MAGFSEILLQAFYYFIVMGLGVAGMFALLRGFLWPYFKVRTSFGKYIMVKVRNPLRDYFAIGWMDEGFLVFKYANGEKRLSLESDDKVIYRCMNVNWVDVDEVMNSIGKANYDHVTGFDAQKYSDLFKRALMRPAVGDNKEKLIIFFCIVVFVMLGVLIYLTYVDSMRMTTIYELMLSMKGIIQQAGTGI